MLQYFSKLSRPEFEYFLAFWMLIERCCKILIIFILDLICSTYSKKYEQMSIYWWIITKCNSDPLEVALKSLGQHQFSLSLVLNTILFDWEFQLELNVGYLTCLLVGSETTTRSTIIVLVSKNSGSFLCLGSYQTLLISATNFIRRDLV